MSDDWLPEFDFDEDDDSGSEDQDFDHSTICPDCGADSDTVPEFGVCQDCFQAGFDDY